MKYQKDFKKVSFGFGNEKVAGNGPLSDQHTPPEKNVDDKTAAITLAVQGLIIVAAVIVESSRQASEKEDEKANEKGKETGKKSGKSKKVIFFVFPLYKETFL